MNQKQYQDLSISEEIIEKDIEIKDDVNKLLYNSEF